MSGPKKMTVGCVIPTEPRRQSVNHAFTAAMPTARLEMAIETGSAMRLPPVSSKSNGHFAVLFARRPDGDFHVLPERGQEFHQPADGEVSRPAPHEVGHMRLFDAKDFTGFGLGQAALL